jgi:hypothetical protein
MPSPTEVSKPSATSAKSGKPHKPATSSSDSDFSMPHEELLDNFDLDDAGDSSSATVRGKGGKSRRRRIERNHRQDHNPQQQSPSQQVEDDMTEEMTFNVFGRRISRQKETSRIRDVETADMEDIQVMRSRGESGKRLTRRLRTRGVSSD